MDKKIYYLGGISFLILSLMLYTDICLLSWYEKFYQSINQKNSAQFYENIGIFLIISTTNGISLTSLTYVLELLDLQLKLNLSTIAIRKFSKQNFIKTNQKPIDDATLAAERLSSTLPMFSFNLLKMIFLIILLISWSPIKINIDSFDIKIPYPLLITSITFLTIQSLIAKSYFPLLKRTDKLKRKVENIFRMTLLGINQNSNINNGLKKYLNAINTIRKHTAIKNFSLSLSIALITTISYVIPYIIVFNFYMNNELTFGEVMKLSATFGFFQNSAVYVVNNFKELSRGLAALKRVVS